MKVELLEELPAEEIGHIWQEFHREKDGLAAVIPREAFARLEARAAANPLFLYALPREGGIEFFYAQFSGGQCAFTSLLEFKTHQEHARPNLVMTHYKELLGSKDIVLMRGEVQKLSVPDAQFLANQMQLYYLGTDANYALVETFNQRPEEFDHQQLIDRLADIQLFNK